MQRTTLNSLTVNQLVNIERAARFGDEIGGHLLSGHIFGKGSIAQIDQGHWKIDCPQEWLKYILEKGFIAIDGVSLTIGRVDLEGFFIHLIPETLKTTTFSSKKIGDEVNIELDHQTQAIVDTVERLINQRYPK